VTIDRHPIGYALFLAATGMLVSGCAVEEAAKRPEQFEAAPNPIDDGIANASTEEYILALPTYHFHEESPEAFAARVHGARMLPQNKGKDRDYLFVPGDGAWPSKEFTLHRLSRRLIIRVHATEIDGGYTTTMRRVPGGWVRNG
jgi:hypothetical protein